MATDTASQTRTESEGWSTQATLAAAVGGVLTLVGLAGFVVGDMLLIFGINTLHNVVHLATGALGLVAGVAASRAYAGSYNRALGVVYVVVFVAGIAAPVLMESLLNANLADHVLHLALGVVLGGVGYGATR